MKNAEKIIVESLIAIDLYELGLSDEQILKICYKIAQCMETYNKQFSDNN